MKFRIKDREYEWDGDHTLAEAMLFFDKAGVGVAEVQREMVRGNPYVTATLMYILKKRAGEAVRWQDMQEFSITDLQPVLEGGEESAEASGEQEPVGDTPDPTEVSGTSPEPDTGTTS